ncbi:MAG TPA: Gfo/Idh/MocA family oxidoreductase [Candidatus Hydrogenedentes bacterium]|nr:Gfo/Idh/MocA family oxidoreductase [Candidatus Hydrogenedentota bacterium]
MTVRIGFIGCGGNANWHMDSLVKNAPEARIVAVTDLAFPKAEATASKHGAKPYASHKEMLAHEDLDCCYISIPPHQHGEPEIDVIQKGLPFFVEKPLATSLVLAEDILERIQRRGIKTCVGYQIRYLDICDKAREMLKGQFINAVNAHYVGGAPGGWYTRMALSGGQITEQATHLIDMMRFILGEIAWLAATNRTGAKVTADTLDATALSKGSAADAVAGLDVHDYNIWDATALLMKFRSGIPATFMCSCQVPYMWDVIFDIFTTEFRLKLTFAGMEITRKAGAELKTETIPADDSRNIDAVFVDAVKRNDFSNVRSDYADALRSLRATLAATEAAMTGRIINLPAE